MQQAGTKLIPTQTANLVYAIYSSSYCTDIYNYLLKAEAPRSTVQMINDIKGMTPSGAYRAIKRLHNIGLIREGELVSGAKGGPKTTRWQPVRGVVNHQLRKA